MPTRCQECDVQIPEGSQFCPQCGSKAEQGSNRLQSLGEKETIEPVDEGRDGVLGGLLPGTSRGGSAAANKTSPGKQTASGTQSSASTTATPSQSAETENRESSGMQAASRAQPGSSPSGPASDEMEQAGEDPGILFDGKDDRPEPVLELVPLDPKIDYLVELLPDRRLRPWPLERSYYSIGREGAKISLSDRTVSRRHLALTRIGPDWVLIQDSRTEKTLTVGGWRLRQKTLRHGDVIRIGKTWLVFVPGPEGELETSLRSMPGLLTSGRAGGPQENAQSSTPFNITLDEDDEEDELAYLELAVDGKQLATSGGEPLVIGSHALCNARLQGANIAPVHCLLSWRVGGLTLFDLAGGTLLKGMPIKKARLRDGQWLQIGERRIVIKITGDSRIPAANLTRRMEHSARAVALTAFHGPHAGETVLLPPGQAVTLGRGDGVDLAMPKEKQIASQQLQITLDATSLRDPAGRPVVELVEIHARVPTLVNRKVIKSTGTATVGDVIQFGSPKRVAPTGLLVHYDTALDCWPAG